MPKRSKIVSGKVISAVEQSRSSVAPVEAVVSLEEATVPVMDQSIDIKSRFQTRKDELETNRHAKDPINIRRVEKRRAAEEKKKKRQQKRLIDKDPVAKSVESDSVAKRQKSEKDVVEEGGNFVFNRLDDAETGKHQVKTGKKTISDPKQALQKLQAQQDKLEKLKSVDSEKAAVLEEKLRVKKALQKAQGVSIKDDVNLLKKAIQRREKEKEKSRDTWNKTKTEQKEKVDKIQSKRNENIQSRIDAKKNKKMGIKVKKPQKKPQKKLQHSSKKAPSKFSKK